MKKLILVLALVLGMQGFAEKSQATVIIVPAIAPRYGEMMPWAYIIYGTGGLVVSAIAGGITAIFNPALGLKIGLIGVALDTEGQFPKDNLKTFLQNRYDFINNQETFTEMSKAIEAEYQTGNNEVHLSEEKINQLLLAHDLTSEEYAQVLHDLR